MSEQRWETLWIVVAVVIMFAILLLAAQTEKAVTESVSVITDALTKGKA